jgi:hypothetical protein
MYKTGKGACYSSCLHSFTGRLYSKTKTPPKMSNISRYIIKVIITVYLREGGPNLADEDPVPSLLTNKRDCTVD